MKHKWSEVIKAWADGHEVQWRYSTSKTWSQPIIKCPDFDNDEKVWRVAEPIYYRSYLCSKSRYCNESIYTISGYNKQNVLNRCSIVEKHNNFVKWLDSEVRVEI